MPGQDNLALSVAVSSLLQGTATVGMATLWGQKEPPPGHAGLALEGAFQNFGKAESNWSCLGGVSPLSSAMGVWVHRAPSSRTATRHQCGLKALWAWVPHPTGELLAVLGDVCQLVCISFLIRV